MKKNIKIFSSLSLRLRLIIASILCVLIPSLHMFGLTNYQLKEELTQEAIAQSESTLQVLDTSITKYLDDLLYISNYIQFDNQINTVFKKNLIRSDRNMATDNLNALDHIEISRKLEGVTNLLTPSYLTILLDNGFNYTNYPLYDYNPTNLYENKWVKKAINSNSYDAYWHIHSNFIESPQSKSSHFISLARMLRLSEEADVIVIVSMNVNKINDLFEQSTFNEKHNLMLVNSDGTILSHNQQTKTQQKIPSMEQIESVNGNTSIVSYNNTDYLSISYPLAYADWILISMVPYNDAIGNINVVTNSTLLLQILSFFIFLLILILVVKRLTKPVTRLSFVMNEVEKGNFKIRSGIKGKGDVEQLGYSLDMMIDNIENMIEQIKIEENSKHKAELEMLQAQINPHFLFNILNSIRLKILLSGEEETAKLIQSLSHLLRMTINRNNEFITLEKEIEVIEHYIKLMNFRGKYNTELKKNLGANILAEKIPRFFLQPIIENAIIHGYKQNSGIIWIKACEENEYLLIRVKDNGKGINPEDLTTLRNEILTIKPMNALTKNKSSFTGIGLTNVYQRMLLIYGESFRMEIESQELEGTTITFYIPRKQEG